MAAEFVVDELKLTDIDRCVFGIVLAQEDDGLAGSMRDPKLEKYIRVGR